MAKKAQIEEKSEADVSVKENEIQEPFSVKVRKILFRLIFLAVLGGGAYWVYQNPQIFEMRGDVSQSDENALVLQINQLQNQVATLQTQLLNLPKPDISSFENKAEVLEKQMLNVIDSKADAGIVLGLLTRVDKLESRLDKVVKISDDGALILSAAMLVKQAAADGDPFVYEAEILNQLTPESASIKKDVSVILEYAHNGIVSEKELVRQFHVIYAEAVHNEKEQVGNWKERLNQKVSEYIKIKKAGEGEVSAQNSERWHRLAGFVRDGKLAKVAELIESSENDDIKQNQSLQNWLADVRNQVSFKRAIRNIAAYSLAEMKVNNLKNKE